MIVMERDGRTEHLDTPVEFAVGRAAYAAMTERLDHINDGYTGDPGLCLDGTPVAFERVRGAAITSGTGSASCIQHYKMVSLAVLRGLHASTPQLGLPSDADWMGPR